MNANELADAMQGVISVLNVHHEEDCLFIANDAQYMLRQQQAEIEALKAHPVTEHFEDEPQAEELHEIMQSNLELTDEEIMSVRTHPMTNIDFARAILRKASEK